MKRQIGRTGIEIYPIGLGAMPLSIQDRPSEEQGIAVIHAALDAGVNFIDTANVYCLDQNDIGHNERLIIRALELRNAVKKTFIATKGGLARPNGDWVTDGSPEKLRQACEKSLKDLKAETHFLYQLHAPDDSIPFEDSLEELVLLQKEGKILHIGLSNVSPSLLLTALRLVRIESVQNRCHPHAQADLQNGMIQLCAKNGISYIPYSPVGGGYGHKSVTQDPLLIRLAQKYRTTPYCVALNWLLSLGPHVIPIPGARRVASIQNSASAPQYRMDKEDLNLITKVPLKSSP